MTTEPVILPPDATVAEALARIRNADLSPGAGRAGLRLPPAAGDPDRAASSGIAHFQRLLREPPSTLVSGGARHRPRAARARRRRCRGHPLPRDLQPGRAAGRRRATTTCSARSPSTTCSTTCCPRTGATATPTTDDAPTEASAMAREPRAPVRAGSTSRATARAGPAPDVRPGGVRPALASGSPASSGTGRFLVYMTVVHRRLDRLEHRRARTTCASTRTRSSS